MPETPTKRKQYDAENKIRWFYCTINAFGIIKT